MLSRRYSLATAFLSSLFVNKVMFSAHAHEDEEFGGSGVDATAWSYLPLHLPTPLSDMSVDILPSSAMTAAATTAKNSIVLAGGCDSADGNVYFEADWGEGFSCSSISSKVRRVYLDPLLSYIH